MSAFNAYVLGFIVFIIGVALAATLLGVPPTWVGVGAVILSGIGILSAVTHTKRKDLPEES